MSDPPASVPIEVRPARAADADAVEAIAAETWTEREGAEYLPRVFEDWLDRDGARTVVADVTDPDAEPDGAPAVAGVAQVVLLSEDEAWAQGMRVHPAYRGRGVGAAVVADLFDWARERGATVARNMVYSWNGAGLGQSRATGFEPATEIRFVHPEPDDAADPDATVRTDPAAAWRSWTDSDARERLRGLAADDEESWALRELTRDDLEAAADDEGAIAVETDEGTVAAAVRSRVEEIQPADGESASDESDSGGRLAVYGASAWDDRAAAAALFDAISGDAAAVGADRTKVLVPESVRHVSDAAACRVEIGDEPEFVLAADLTARR